jgi:hypothetical protein
MKTSSRLIIALGIVAAFVGGLVSGVPFGTFLLVGAVMLLCPAMMFFGMHGMQHGNCPKCERDASDQNQRRTASV